MRKITGICLLALSLALACIGGILIYQKICGYKENEEIYEKAASIAVLNKNDDKTSSKKHPDGAGLTENEYHEKENGYDGPTIDWEKLDGKSVRAWIMFEGNSIINYPVVQGTDNSYYLHHAYDGTYNANGSVFMNADNDSYFRDMNTILYGHNLRSGRMFGTFRNYLADKVAKKLHFYIYTPDGKKRTYEIISIAETKDGGYAYSYAFSKIHEYKEYLSKIKNDSSYDTGYGIDETKRVVTLSTCRSIGSAQGWRVIIVGKEAKIETIQKPASWYKKPEDEVITVLDVEKNIKKTGQEIEKIKKERKEQEVKDQNTVHGVQTEGQNQ